MSCIFRLSGHSAVFSCLSRRSNDNCRYSANGFLSSVGICYSIDAFSFFFVKDSFGASTLAFSSDILFCGALFAISGVAVLGFLSDSVLYGRLLWIHGAKIFFGSSIFGSFGAPCFRSDFSVDIRNFDFWFFCRVLFLLDASSDSALRNFFAVIRCLFLLSLCRLCGGCFAIFGGQVFVFLLWSCLFLVLSARFGFLSRAFPLRLSSFCLLLVSLLLGVGRGRGLSPFSAPPFGALRPRIRRCKQELAHGCTPSLPPFLLLAVLPPFPLVAAGLLSFPPSPSLFFLSLLFLFLSFFLSLFLSFLLSLSVFLSSFLVWFGFSVCFWR